MRIVIRKNISMFWADFDGTVRKKRKQCTNVNDRPLQKATFGDRRGIDVVGPSGGQFRSVAAGSGQWESSDDASTGVQAFSSSEKGGGSPCRWPQWLPMHLICSHDVPRRVFAKEGWES